MEVLKADMARLQTELFHARNDLNRLLKITVDGNGHSLVSRILILETHMNTLEEEWENFEVERKDDKKAERTRIQAIQMAFVTAILSFITSTGLILFNLFVRH